MAIIKALGLASLLTLATSVTHAEDLATHTFQNIVDSNGTISLPADARESWVHLGSWVVNEAGAPGAGFHDVYTQPEAAQTYRESGEFADGTVLIKEIRSILSGDKTTGPALWAGEPQVWFVMVRDRQNRFDGPHWGEGWGWALYKADNPTRNVSESFEATCKGCHTPAQQTNWVFIEGYPTLK
ncbi:MAG: cytochrome P460 family protein [Marinobacter sp.]|uniref:cytochrome P460 family protein n=1 Tax=Marinobacter sp. TaxID=50741 RepID=UPI00299D013C|nr:cytochrome P460 family protein [Marinobacter sp.]MDX1757513.1 cytochrome P460 family protein [Marinobacter sp.]